MGRKIVYARVSTADQNPDLQLDTLAADGYLKIYTDIATGTKSDRPQWNECLKDLAARPPIVCVGLRWET